MGYIRSTALVLLPFSFLSPCQAARPTEPPGPPPAGSAAAAPAQPDARRAALEAELARIAASSGGRVGIAAVNLATNERVELDAAEPFHMASVCKFPIAVGVLRLVQAGTLDLSKAVSIGPEDYYPGSNSPLRDAHKRAAASVSVRELLERMLIDSDNTACDVLLQVAGGPGRITAELRALGIEGVDVSRSEAEMLADMYSATPPAGGRWTYTALGRATQTATEAQKREGLARFRTDVRDTATPAALAGMLARLSRGELLDAERTQFLLSTMERCATGKRRLRAAVPPGTRLAEKTGTFPALGAINDVGLADLPGGGKVAIAVLMKGAGEDTEDNERVIAEAGRAIYGYFTGK